MKPFDYLNTSVKSYGRASKVHGIGLFALVDIKEGEQVFPEWKGETSWYKITWDEAQNYQPKFWLMCYVHLVVK